MKRKIVFATNNPHKVEEIRYQLSNQFEIISLREAGIDIEIPEPHDTLAANASEKSGTIERLTGMDCFSEDTGLEVDCLDGLPGVKSARFAEPGEPYTDNVDKLISKINHKNNCSARFRTVVSLRMNNEEFLFEGICEGKIIHNRRGINGFGYDPVFVPNGSDKTFAEMTLTEKSLFSHRAKAVEKLAGFLQHCIKK